MPTSKEKLDSLRKALALVPEVAFVPTMGEYSVYSRGRLFAMVAEGELFIRTSPETLCLFRDKATRAYPGGLNTCRADAEWLEDPEKLGEAVLYTLAFQPAPKPASGGKGTASLRTAGEVWLARLPWALACCAAFTALYFILPYRVLGSIGIHKGTRADSFAVTGLHGEKLRLSDCAGKPVFLYLWESDSQRAIDNLPLLDALYASYKDRPVCFVTATLTADFNCAVKAFAATKALRYPVYNGAGQFRPPQSPMLYLIDHQGYLRKSYSPSSGSLPKITSDLEGLLSAVPPAQPGPKNR